MGDERRLIDGVPIAVRSIDGVPLVVSSIELGFLLHAVWEPARHGDIVARGLFEKVRAAVEATGVKWVFGRPWVEEEPKELASSGIPK